MLHTEIYFSPGLGLVLQPYSAVMSTGVFYWDDGILNIMILFEIVVSRQTAYNTYGNSTTYKGAPATDSFQSIGLVSQRSGW
jgi:hypothetical protein